MRPRDALLAYWRQQVREHEEARAEASVQRADDPAAAPGRPGEQVGAAPPPEARSEHSPVGAAPAGPGQGVGGRLDPEQLQGRIAEQDARGAVHRRSLQSQQATLAATGKEDGEDLAQRHLRLPPQRPTPPEASLLSTLASLRKEAVASQRTVRPKRRSAQGSLHDLPHPGAWRAQKAEGARSLGAQQATLHRPMGNGPTQGVVAFT